MDGVAMNACWAAIAAAGMLLLQPFGRPSVTNTTEAARPGVFMVYCVAYCNAPWSAGTVGVLPLGMSPAMAPLIALALPGSAAIATLGMAYDPTLHALLPSL